MSNEVTIVSRFYDDFDVHGNSFDAGSISRQADASGQRITMAITVKINFAHDILLLPSRELSSNH